MQGLYSIGLLIVSNVFMTLAWYGHLKLQEMKVINNWPLYCSNIVAKYQLIDWDLERMEDRLVLCN